MCRFYLMTQFNGSPSVRVVSNNCYYWSVCVLTMFIGPPCICWTCLLVHPYLLTVFNGPPCICWLCLLVHRISVCCIHRSHLVTVATGPRLSDALISSPVIVEDGAAVPGAGFEFGIDPNEDPELALVRNCHMLLHRMSFWKRASLLFVSPQKYFK